MISDLHEKLKKLRCDLGLSQKDVAKRLDLSPSIVSGYETGERVPSTESLLALSYLYKCSTDFLLGKEKPSKEKLLDVSSLTDEQIIALNRLIDAIAKK